MLASSGENTTHIDPQSKEEQEENTRPKIPKPKPLKIAWPPNDYDDVKKTIAKRETNAA